MDEKKCRSCGRIYKNEQDYLQSTSRWRVCEAGNLWFNCNCDSTLVLTAENYRNSGLKNKQLKLSDEARTVFHSISQIHSLPHLPTVIMELQQKLEDVDVSAHELASSLRKEPFISAQVLAIFYNMRSVRGGKPSEKPASLEHAISYIGRQPLANLVMLAYFEKIKVKTQKFSLSEFWTSALKTAGIAEWLCSRMGYQEKDRAYLSGYLCNLGKIVASIVYPEETDQIWETGLKATSQTTWSEMEMDLGLPDHCILGEIGLAFWGLPEFLKGPVRYHHEPDLADKESREHDKDLIHLVSLANMLTHWISLEPSRFHDSDLEREKNFFHIQGEELDNMAYELSILFRPVL